MVLLAFTYDLYNNTEQYNMRDKMCDLLIMLDMNFSDF